MIGNGKLLVLHNSNLLSQRNERQIPTSHTIDLFKPSVQTILNGKPSGLKEMRFHIIVVCSGKSYLDNKRMFQKIM